MKILGVGLSRTGTSSLHAALEFLGFSSLHYDTVRLNDVLDGSNPHPNFKRYDDLDAVVDLPAAYFYDELTAAYPECKCILTVRNIDDWWKSVSKHLNERLPAPPPGYYGIRARIKRYLNRSFPSYQEDAKPDLTPFRILSRTYVYGSATAHEYLYKKKFVQHNQRVISTIPSEKLLVMDISAGDGWDTLCPFLEVSIPPISFPHTNKTTD